MPDENAQQTHSAQAPEPKRIDRTRAVMLNKPPEPNEEALKERERCIAGTHSDAGPMPHEGARRRGEPMEEPNVPPTEVEEPAAG